jgi:acyl-CoA synthetase (AMP-forming)/AMP-acid ligase II
VVVRKKDMIKTGGRDVASGRLEEVLYEFEGIEGGGTVIRASGTPSGIEVVTAVIVPK